MVIIKLMGGLGNQMFQYAAGRRLAYIHDTDLKIDLAWFDSINAGDTVREFDLGVFNIKADFAAPGEVEKLRLCGRRGWRTLLSLSSSKFSGNYIQEKDYHFDPTVLKLPDNVYLEGYWQSEKYFIDIEDVIRKEFTIKTKPDQRNKIIAEEIEEADTVSIHIRRGDYVSSQMIHEFHGVCSLDYYRTAIEKIAAQVQRPHFYVFSDDPGWVKENLNPAYPVTIVDFNGPGNAYEDLRLMSLCKHHIIANSSFSWWGAWLCTKPSKTVIAPKKWFNRNDINTNDLIPDGWIRI